MSAPIRPRAVARPLSELLGRVEAELVGDPTTCVSGATHDSRQVQAGDVYVAIPGFTAHGAQFVGPALDAGAAAVMTDAAGAATLADLPVPLLVVPDPRAASGPTAAWAYGDPADDLLLIGVTGTNGKTTTTYLVDAGLRAAGHATGLIGTLGAFVGDSRIPTSRTTPEATDVHALLGVMRERGVTAVSMEVSSHALALHRVGGLVFDVAGFTNLSQDHLDFHGTMEAYFEAKAGLFTARRSRRAVVCVDGAWGARLFDRCEVPASSLATEGSLADWQVTAVRRGPDGRQSIDLRQPDGSPTTLETWLPGRFNVANVALAHALLRTAGVPADRSASGLAAASGVPGRMERVTGGIGGLDVFVDYAHSPDAIDRVVQTAREFTSGRVIVVVGGGGDRDREKRPLMGRAASAADVVIIADDNPRSEDPASIRASILAGIPAGTTQAHEVGDRREAIRRAVGLARPGDTVLVLGKGHETGQEVAGTRTDFDDRVEAAAALALGGGA